MATYKTSDLIKMRNDLDDMLPKTDVIGFAAAKNARVLDAELSTFNKKRDELIRELGEEDEENSGSYSIQPNTEAYSEFAKRLMEYAEVECEVSICTIAASKAEGKLSGSEMLKVEWMLDWDE